MSSALQMYGRALADQTVAAVSIHFEDGAVVPLAVDRYLAPADRDDGLLLADVTGPVLDVGCGPGRHLRALIGRGEFALGVDISPVAVGLAVDGGGRAIVADVFDELPGAGSWRTALLLDGNIGIGGAPVRLLRRLRSILHPAGQVVAELQPPGAECRATRARIDNEQETSEWFPWALVSASEIAVIAAHSGLRITRTMTLGRRWFVFLQPCTDS